MRNAHAECAKPEFTLGEKLEAIVGMVASGMSLRGAMLKLGHAPSMAYHWAEKDEDFRRRIQDARANNHPLKRFNMSSAARWDALMTPDAVEAIAQRIRTGERQTYAVKAVVGMVGMGPTYYRWKSQRPEIAKQIDAAVDDALGGLSVEARARYIEALLEGWGRRKAAKLAGVSVTVIHRWLWAPFRDQDHEGFARAAAQAWETGRAKREAPDAKRRRRYDSTKRSQHGMSAEAVEAMLAAQGGKCPGCETTIRLYAGTGAGTGAVLDHCHATGRVRGLLCPGCNMALGSVKDDPRRLARLQRYLESQPTA